MPPDQMSFEGETRDYAQPRAARFSLITGLVVRWGLATGEREAQKVLLIVVVLAAAAAILVFAFSGGSSAKPPVPSIDGTYPAKI